MAASDTQVGGDHYKQMGAYQPPHITGCSRTIRLLPTAGLEAEAAAIVHRPSYRAWQAWHFPVPCLPPSTPAARIWCASMAT